MSVARLRDEIFAALYESLEESGMSKADLARALGVQRTAVNEVFNGNGNLQVDTIARYLHELGKELVIEVVHVGEPYRRIQEEMKRKSMKIDEPNSFSASIPLEITQDVGNGLPQETTSSKTWSTV